MDLPVWFEIGSLVGLVVILFVRLLLVVNTPPTPSPPGARLWVGFLDWLAH